MTSSSRRRIAFVRIGWLTVVWLIVWSDLSVANVLSGLLIAGLIVATFDTWRPGTLVVRPLRAIRFAAYFGFQLVHATLVVARTIVAPRDRIHPAVVAVPLSGCSDAIVTLVAHAISLTPGTLTVDVGSDPPTLYVHALEGRDVSQVQRDVRRLEVLAIMAFGDARAVDGLTADDSAVWRSR